MESRNASFLEHVFPYKNKENPKRTPDKRDGNTSGNEASTSGTSFDDAELFEDEPRRSKRARKEKSYGEDFFMLFLLENEPRSFAEAMSSPNADFWKEAFNSEIDSIMQNHTWYLTDATRV